MYCESRQSAVAKVRTANGLLDLGMDPSSITRSRLDDRKGEEDARFDDGNRPRWVRTVCGR